MSTKQLKYLAIISVTGVILLFSLLLTQTRSQPSSHHDRMPPDSPQSSKTFVLPKENLTNFQKSDFYRTIIDNNLFRPLGWRPPRPRETYRLLGTVIPTDGNTEPKAILQATTINRTHTVTLGEKLDKDTIVTNIQPKQVTLEKAGQQRTLTLNPTSWIK